MVRIEGRDAVGGFRREGRIVAFSVVDNEGAIHVRSEEEVFGAWEPANFRDGGRTYDVAFVYAEVFLRVGFEPDDVTRVCACDYIDVAC